MDHGGQCERVESVMSECQGDLWDNLLDPDALGTQNLNLKETHTLSRTHSLTQGQSYGPSQNEESATNKLAQSPSNNTGEVEEMFSYPLGSRDNEEEGEEEENDEVMKEEEEEESEGSTGLFRCQSPGTPMTDSSFSETGSLLETSSVFSPGTSPEPSSPLNPVGISETAYPLSPVELNQWELGTGDSGMGPAFITAGPTCTTASALNPPAGSLEPVSAPEPTCSKSSIASNAELIASTTEAHSSAEVACHVGLSASVVGHSSPTTESIILCTESINTGTNPTSSTGPIISTTDPSGSFATCTTRPSTSAPGPTSISASVSAIVPSPLPSLLASLEQLEQRGDDTHLPQYLHQIAEAFVLQEDYPRAVCCLQLERLYHQRLLDNLSSLQQQWESRCRSSSNSDLATQLDTLTHICQTHNRPSARDVGCASLESLKTSLREDERPSGQLTSCTSGHLTETAMEREQTETEVCLSVNSKPIAASAVLTENLTFTEPSKGDAVESDRDLEERDHLDGDQINDGEETEATGNRKEAYAVPMAPLAGSGNPPAANGEMERSKTAARQGGEGLSTLEKEDRNEEDERLDVQEEAQAAEMEGQGGGEGGGGGGGEAEEEGGEVIPEEFSGTEGLIPLLHQETVAEENQQAQLCLNNQVEEGDRPAQTEPHMQQDVNRKQEEQIEDRELEMELDYELDVNKHTSYLDDQAKLITVEEMTPVFGLVSILKKRNMYVSSCSGPIKHPAKRCVRFKVSDVGFDPEVGGGDSCLLLFLLCLVTVVISIGGTALYCALGDAQSAVCQDFSRNAEFYVTQMQRGIAQIQHWFTTGS